MGNLLEEPLPFEPIRLHPVERLDIDLQNEDCEIAKHESSFSSLAPRRLSDEEFSTYVDEFAFAYRDPSIRNIALSGRYGAGKSSVIRTLQESKIDGLRGHDYIFVSLANFDDPMTSGDAPSVDESGPDSHRVEEKILMQLVHQLDRKGTPKSRFARTVDNGKCRDAALAIAMTAFAALSIALLRWYGKPTITALLLPRVLLGAAVWMVLLGCFLYQVARRGSITGLLRKLKVGSFEVDLGEAAGAAPLDRYMDDLVYLINASGCDVIVFEDLDRFGSVELFEKLREINDLANATRQGDASKPLRFFYLIRDSLFTQARDRTKFFDFIIPVVPFVDPSNAESVLSQRLRSVGVEVDQTFLYQLGLFIDDPRILSDIANEFTHYLQAVLPRNGETKADEYGRLLAIIAFKSLFPEDFELLQAGRGCLGTLLNKRRWLAEKLSGESVGRIDEIENELIDARKLNALDRDELTLLYGIKEVMAEGRFHPWNWALQRPTTKEIIENIRANSSMSDRFDSIAKSLQKNEEYLSRYQDARDRMDRKSAALLIEREELERRVSTIRRLSLRNLLALCNARLVESFFMLTEDDFKRREDYVDLKIEAMMSSPDYPLVRFLLLSGMVDDSYRRYMSYLHPGGVDSEDADFVVSVLQGKETDEAQPIHNPEAVLIRLDEWELMKDSARNRYLFASLLKDNSEKQGAFFKGLKDDGDVRFLSDFIASEQYEPEVFGAMEERLGITVADLVENDALGLQARRDTCHRFMADGIIKEVNDEVLQRVGVFASSDPGFLDARVVEAGSISNKLALISYRPATIDLLASDGRLLKAVISDGLFEPDAALVDGLLTWEEGSGKIALGGLATAVWKRKGSPFFDTVEADLPLFVSTLLKDCPEDGLEDTANAIVWILGSGLIDDGLAEAFARVEHGERLQSISVLSSPVRKGQALEHDLIECNAENVLVYAGEVDDLDEKLAGFLERNGLPEDLTAETCDQMLGSGNALVSYAAKTQIRIPVSLFSSIATACSARYERFELDGVPDERISRMIELGCIEMNLTNLEFLRAHYANHVHELAIHEFSGYVNVVLQDNHACFVPEEALRLLGEGALPTNERLLLIGGFSVALRVSGGYPDEINARIIEEHFDPSDLATIAEMHEGAKPVLKDAIEERMATSLNMRNIGSYFLPLPLLASVLGRMSDKSFSRRSLTVQLGMQDPREVERDGVKRCLIECELPAVAEAMDGRRLKLAPNEADDGIINTLMSLGMLSSKSHKNPDGSWTVHKSGTGRTR